MSAATQRSDDPHAAAHEPVAGAADRATADRRTVRRALVAGAGTFVVVGVVSVATTIATGGTGVAAAIWVTSAVVVGALVSSGWLVLALGLDLIAGVVPSRRRVLWTAAVFAVAFVSPILPAAMLQVAATR